MAMTYIDYVRSLTGSALTSELRIIKGGLEEYERRMSELQEAETAKRFFDIKCSNLENQFHVGSATRPILVSTVIYLLVLTLNIIGIFTVTCVYIAVIIYFLYQAAQQDKAENSERYKAEAEQYRAENESQVSQRLSNAQAMVKALEWYEPYQKACTILPQEYRSPDIVDEFIKISLTSADRWTAIFEIYERDNYRKRMEDLEREKIEEIQRGNEETRRHNDEMKRQSQQQHRDRIRMGEELNRTQKERLEEERRRNNRYY